MEQLYKIKKLFASIGSLITSSLELEEIVDGIMEEVRTFFEPGNWSLLRLDPNTNELFFMIARGIDSDLVKDVRLKPGEGIAGTVAETGEPIYVPDTSKDSRFTDKIDRITGFTTRSVMAVPLIFRDTTYGVIELVSRSENDLFSEDDYLILKTIADFSAIAFSNAVLYEQALLMGSTDPLTGLYNRHKLENLVDDWNSLQHFRRVDDPNMIAIIMVDVDNFKQINDMHGHRQGDRVLKHLARIIRASLRNDDFLFRIGGDEFLAIIRVPPDAKTELVERRLIRNLNKLNRESDNLGFPVLFSYGISIGPPSKIKVLIEESDANMYEQKRKKSTS